MKNLSFQKRSCIFRIVILIILFSSNFFYTQEKKSSIDQSVTIVLAKGAVFYSSDESFNKQILQKKIIIENANLSFGKSSNSKILVLSSRRPKAHNLAQQLKSSQEKKRREAIRQIKAKIDDYELKSKFFETETFHNSPSTSQFFSSSTTVKNYICPNYNGNDFSKIYAEAKGYFVKRALDFLHSQKYKCYNNKSLDFCFSKVFSVRPPPYLINYI